MPSVAAVHEQVHERAQRQERPRKELDHVRAVFGPQKVGRDRREPGQRDPVENERSSRRADTALAVSESHTD